MFDSRPDSVSNIHRRWSFIRLNPSSHRVSYLISLLSAAAIIIFSHVYIVKTHQIGLAIYIPVGLIASTCGNFIEYHALHGTPNNKISKIFHVSAFANLVWAVTILLGITAATLLSRDDISGNYIAEGMLLAVGIRVGIFTSVFGARVDKAIVVSFFQPLVFLITFLPFVYYSYVFTSASMLFGAALIILAFIWAIIADRAGRPDVKSTFAILQAFLAAWTENKSEKMEEIAEERAHNELVTTYIVIFKLSNSKEVSIIIPDVHPGPFNPIGGSNLPYALYTAFYKNALVMHSVSDHSLNIPSKLEVKRYIETLATATILERQDLCTIPIQIKMGKCTVTGIGFGADAMVILSMAPVGMEDIPDEIRTGIEQYSVQLGLRHVLVIDSHNAMGEHLTKEESYSLLSAAKVCLEKLTQAQQYKFKIGFANSEDIPYNINSIEDLGKSGIATIAFEVKGNRYLIGWADANNMKKGLRDHIISTINSNRMHMLEVCTSDTHSTSGKRTRQGYYSFGDISNYNKVAELYFQLSKLSIDRICSSTFELLYSESNIKVMGKKQFDDYSSALDRSMRVTKIFLGFTIATFLVMLIYS